MDWPWILECFYSIYVPKAAVEIYKTVQFLVEFWGRKPAEMEFFLKMMIFGLCGSGWVLSGTGTVNKDNLKWPGGPKSALLNCFLPNFSIVLYPLWALVGGCWVEKGNAFFIVIFIIIIILWKQQCALIPNVNFMQLSHGLSI